MKNSLYIHIPFCRSICPYCDFHKEIAREEKQDEYVDALIKEAKLKYQKGFSLSTIYIGGGTPSSLSYTNLEKILSFINDYFDLSELIEFTIEINVSDLCQNLLVLLRKYKVNRYSIGIQTISPRGQILLNRYHKQADIISRFKEFENLNICNYSVDLMYGYPDETLDELICDLDFVTSLNPAHISIYCLIKEDNSVFGKKDIKELDESLQEKMYFTIIDYLEKKEYYQYEVSNFSKKGYESVHNNVYFKDSEYYSLGSGASSFISNKHYQMIRSVRKYIDEISIDCLPEEVETLSNGELYDEFVMMNLRTRIGLSLDEFYNKFNCNFYDIYHVNLDELNNKKLIEVINNRIRIKKEALFISNYVYVEILKTRSE